MYLYLSYLICIRWCYCLKMKSFLSNFLVSFCPVFHFIIFCRVYFLFDDLLEFMLFKNEIIFFEWPYILTLHPLRRMYRITMTRNIYIIWYKSPPTKNPFGLWYRCWTLLHQAKIYPVKKLKILLKSGNLFFCFTFYAPHI